MSRETVLILASMDPVEVGPVESWPIHATVIPPFEIAAASTAAFDARVLNVLGEIDEIPVVGLETVYYGPGKDVRARRIASPVLRLVHERLLDVVGEFGGVVDPTYSGDRFSPHISYKEDRGLAQGMDFVFRSIQRGVKRDGSKQIAAVYPLGLDQSRSLGVQWDS